MPAYRTLAVTMHTTTRAALPVLAEIGHENPIEGAPREIDRTLLADRFLEACLA